MLNHGPQQGALRRLDQDFGFTAGRPRSPEEPVAGRAARSTHGTSRYPAESRVPRRPPPHSPLEVHQHQHFTVFGSECLHSLPHIERLRRPFGVIGTDPRAVEHRVPDLRGRACRARRASIASRRPTVSSQGRTESKSSARRASGCCQARTNVSCTRSSARWRSPSDRRSSRAKRAAVLALQRGQLVLGGRPVGDGGGSGRHGVYVSAPRPARTGRGHGCALGGRSSR